MQMEGSVDQERFDHLAVATARSVERRSTLRTILAATSLSTVGALVLRSDGQARKRKSGKKPTCPTCPTCLECTDCPECQECEECPVCVPLGQGAACASNADCCANETNLVCGAVGGEGPVCCGGFDTECAGDGECCDGLSCRGHRCKAGSPEIQDGTRR